MTPSFRRKAGIQRCVGSSWLLVVKPFLTPHPDLPPSTGKGYRKGLRRGKRRIGITGHK